MKTIYRVTTAAVFVLLTLTACNRTPPARGFIGATEGQLLATMGAPTLETTAGGLRYLTYHRTNPDGSIGCKRSFIVRDDGVVGVSSTCQDE